MMLQHRVDTELTPCRCGSTDFEIVGDVAFYVRCIHCCDNERGFHSSIAVAVNAWNEAAANALKTDSRIDMASRVCSRCGYHHVCRDED